MGNRRTETEPTPRALAEEERERRAPSAQYKLIFEMTTQMLAELPRMPGLGAVPAIALTGHAMDDDRERALAAGFAVHLPKPVDPDELLRVVRQLTA